MQTEAVVSARAFVNLYRRTPFIQTPEPPTAREFINGRHKQPRPVSRETYDQILCDLLCDWAFSQEDIDFVKDWVATEYVVVLGAVAA